MTGSEFQTAALRTANANSKHDLLINGVMGMCGEAGEAIDIVKKYMFQGHHLDIPHLISELGDVLWYVAITAEAIGFSMDDIMLTNVDKLLARYPEGFDADKSKHRKEGDV